MGFIGFGGLGFRVLGGARFYGVRMGGCCCLEFWFGL